MPQQLSSKSRTTVGRPRKLLIPFRYGWAEGGYEYVTEGANYDQPLFGTLETLTSVGHRGPPYYEGGPFRLKRFTWRQGSTQLSLPAIVEKKFPTPQDIGAYKFIQRGEVTIDPSYVVFFGVPSPPYTDEALRARFDAISYPALDLATYGPQAIAKYSPLKPGVSFGQFIGELGSLPQIPLLLKKRLYDFKSLGADYLNVEFGWKPFLKDLQDFYSTWLSLDSRMRQIVRDNGKPVRRRGTLSTINETEPTMYPGYYFPIHPPLFVGSGTHYGSPESSKTVQTNERVWFAGRMRYYLPFEPENKWPLNAKLALFGLNPTPSLLYELMPWSWLIDWFSNLGEVISNFSSNGIADLILDYGYVMRHRKVTTTIDMALPSHITWTSPEDGPQEIGFGGSLQYITEEETKERVAATPFGFGLQIDDLSERQLAILIALGLSRQNFL